MCGCSIKIYTLMYTLYITYSTHVCVCVCVCPHVCTYNMHVFVHANRSDRCMQRAPSLHEQPRHELVDSHQSKAFGAMIRYDLTDETAPCLKHKNNQVSSCQSPECLLWIDYTLCSTVSFRGISVIWLATIAS